MASVSSSTRMTWADYIVKYKEASNLIASSQDAVNQLNTDLSTLNSGTYMAVQGDIATIQSLVSSGYFPDLNPATVKRYMDGMNQALTQVLSNYTPLVNGSPVAADLNVPSGTSVNANIVSGDYEYLDATDIENLPGMPNSSDFQNNLEQAIDNSISVSYDSRNNPHYSTSTQTFTYDLDGLSYSVTISPLYAGPGGTKTRVTITANGSIGSLANMGLVSVQLKAGAPAGVGNLANFLNQF